MPLYYRISGEVVKYGNCSAVLKLDSKSKRTLAFLLKLCQRHEIPSPVKSGAVKLKVTTFTKRGSRVKLKAKLDVFTKASP